MARVEPASTTPLPQDSDRQAAEQPSPGVVLPSSHTSPALRFMFPFPHDESWQVSSQVADSPPSSHGSPADAFLTPSPQTTGVQSASHTADSPPSSHASTTLLATPSPQSP